MAVFFSCRIHESLDYLESRATVFHSRYLSAWASTDVGAKLSVVLGHFVLPPACLQEGQEKKKTIRVLLPWESPHERSLLGVQTRTSRNNAQIFFPRYSSEEETGSRAPAQGEFPYRTLQEYPTNNMVTGYTSARDMKKYVGELCDFIPGSSGYAVYWIQNEINIYSDVKTKTKRRFK
uniref:Telomere repeat binding bouquet formation protein 2 n=1 Tax=Aquila chrysaetos chrysaetos TaxID=223781 RepID=A0A663DRJ7_AQUCH